MDRHEFFIKGCRAGRYKERRWVYDIFTVKRRPKEAPPPPETDHYCVFEKDGVYMTHLPNQPNVVILEKGQPIPTTKTLLDVLEQIKLDVGDLENVKSPVITTPGNVFINCYCLIQAFGKKVPFQTGSLLSTKLGDLIVNRIKDDVPVENRTEEDIYVDETSKFLSYVLQISSFGSINVPSATKYTISYSKDVRALRDKLIEENKDKLDDPLVIAQISEAIVKADKEWQKQDPDGGFLDVGKKAYGVSRKKMYGMIGTEVNMAGDKTKFIKTSLSEGVDIESWPIQIDALRAGSFSRGAMTALGGVEVKFIFRAFNTTTIIKEDCGTKLGILRRANEKNLKNAMSRYIFINGKEYLVTKDNIKQLINENSHFFLRSPGYCQADKEGRGYCLKCMGEMFRGNEKGLAALTSAIASQMNSVFMGAMHGKPTVAIPVDMEDVLS